MAKYIEVNVKLNKIIKVDNDNLEQALEIAKDQFQELELTSEWLDARDVTFSENQFIQKSVESIAKLFHEDFKINDLREFVDMIISDKDTKEYIYEETLDLLKNKYNIDIKI